MLSMLQRDVPSIDLYRLDWCMFPQISQIYSVIHPGKRHNICERCMISEPKKSAYCYKFIFGIVSFGQMLQNAESIWALNQGLEG